MHIDKRIKNVVAALELPKEYFGLNFNLEEEEDLSSIVGAAEVRDSVYTVEEDVEFKFGSTKFIIDIAGVDNVIKIPFNGCVPVDMDEFDYFYGADASNESDYCEAELIAYENSKLMGVNKLFAEIIKYSSIDSTSIYIQEKVTPLFEYEHKTPSKKATEAVKNINISIDKEWLAIAYDWYGEKLINDFINFVDDYGINDLYHNNVGFRKNGEPVVLDYSSYNESY